jgi:hypothetical protein
MKTVLGFNGAKNCASICTSKNFVPKVGCGITLTVPDSPKIQIEACE